MTLLESLIALVILGLAGVGFLEAFEGTSRSTRDAQVWMQAVAYGEASMEQTKLGSAPPDLAATIPLPSGFTRAIDVQPLPGVPGVEQITVTIKLPRGGAFTLRRLARAP